MRILVHDYAGHALHVQLSRALAERGHSVLHLFCDSHHWPQGAVRRMPHDPPNFLVQGLSSGARTGKYAYFRRWFQEGAYGRRLARVARGFAPDVAISGNTPLDVQASLQRACRRSNVPFVFWLQDLLSIGMSQILRKELPLFGGFVARYYEWMERSLLRSSDAVVAISEDFLPHLGAWDISADKVTCIPNWGPLGEIWVRPKNNAWAAKHRISDRFCFLYGGTLGLKHNPRLLLSLAKGVAAEGAAVLVVSEGPGAEWLRTEAERQRVENLYVLGFQPYEQLSDMLGAADVLVAILEPYASAFSVPSKILTYLCAERPLLLAVPRENLAARVVRDSDAGRVTEPDDDARFVRAALDLLRDPVGRSRHARNARRYASTNFQIDGTAIRFERVLGRALENN